MEKKSSTTPQQIESLGTGDDYNKYTSTTGRNRLQQSCVQCRQRRIKCDRKSPCGACKERNGEDLCEYVRTDKDRYHISKAKEIQSLRKELNQLKRQLEDGEEQQQQQQQQRKQTKRKQEPQLDQREGQLQRRAGGDASGQMASLTVEQATLTYQESYGIADNGGTPFWSVERAQQSSVQSSVPYPSLDIHGLNTGVQDSYFIPGYNGLGEAGSGMLATTTDQNKISAFQPVLSHVPQREIFYSTDSSSFTQQNNNDIRPTTTTTTSTTTSLHPELLHKQLQQHPQTPDFWRGKPEILEAIYKIVCDCDDYWVPSIIEIVRTCLSPEEAMWSIQRLLMDDDSAMRLNANNAYLQSPDSSTS